MHISFVTPEYVTPNSVDGGLANYLKKTAEALVSRGNRVTIFLLSDSDAIWFDNKIQIFETAREKPSKMILKIPIINTLFSFYYHIRNSQKIARRVINLHKEHPLDIIQTSSYMAPGYSLLNNKQIPIVCRASSFSPRVRKAYGRSTNGEDIITDWLELQQMKKSDAQFSPSEFISKLFSEKLGKKIPTIRTLIDIPSTSEFDDSLYTQLLRGKKYILFFGTLSRIKGVDLIAEIIPKILQSHPDVYFVFIGRDDGMPRYPKIYDYIRERSKPLENHVVYHPAISKSQLYPIIFHATYVVMPSRVDNYPNACLEAQFLGIPVIGTNNSSLDEMIIDGQTGFLANNEDTDSLYTAVEKALTLTTEEYEKMTIQIKKQIKIIQEEDRIGQLIDFYETIITKYSTNERG